MKDKNSKYGVRPEEEFGVVQEIWKRKDLLTLCVMMGWQDLLDRLETMEITPKRSFTDKIKCGDIQIILYRKIQANNFDEEEDCPFHFTVEECK